MICKLSHIAIAVRSIENSLKFYENILRLQTKSILKVTEEGVRVAKIDGGHVTIELIEPLDNTSFLISFLEKRCEALHHIAFQVSNIEEILQIIQNQGIELFTPEPLIGSDRQRIVFLSPKSCHGVLIELCEIADSKDLQKRRDGGFDGV